MKIAFCWSNPSGYMAACWRTLAERADCDVFVLAFEPEADTNTNFDARVMDGIRHRLLSVRERQDYRVVSDIILGYRPDAIVVGGWRSRQYRRLASDPRLKGTRLVLMIDNPIRRGVRQRLGRLVLRPYLQRMHIVFVPGERAWQAARFYGVPEDRIFRGTYGIDYARLSGLHEQREANGGGWPRVFLFVGRYERTKGVDLLLDAYGRYRQLVEHPWELMCCGMGPMGSLIAGAEGVREIGFRQPDQMREVWLEAGAFVLPSRFDPWPVALAEACAAGLPVVCSEACGSGVELVRPLFNGLAVPTGSVDSLAGALGWVHDHADEMVAMGARSRDLAAPYSAQMWADRVLRACAAPI
jgi:glycosyltransferase involved in cell wall biosynthesis